MFTRFTVDYMTLFGVWTAICAYSTINTLERSPNGMCSNFTKSKVELQIKNWMQNILSQHQYDLKRYYILNVMFMVQVVHYKQFEKVLEIV